MGLSTPYGVREVSLRGAPMDRIDWLRRHEGHDVRRAPLTGAFVALTDETREAERDGKSVTEKTGKKLEVRGGASTNLELLLCTSCGVVGFDPEPTQTDATPKPNAKPSTTKGTTQ